MTRERVRLHSQVESLLEDARIKLATCVSDLLGLSSRRMLQGLAAGQTDPTALAALAEPERRATPEQLIGALQAAQTMSPLHRQILHQQIEYIEYGQQRDERALQHRLAKLARQLRSFGYQVVPPPAQTTS